MSIIAEMQARHAAALGQLAELGLALAADVADEDDEDLEPGPAVEPELRNSA